MNVFGPFHFDGVFRVNHSSTDYADARSFLLMSEICQYANMHPTERADTHTVQVREFPGSLYLVSGAGGNFSLLSMDRFNRWGVAGAWDTPAAVTVVTLGLDVPSVAAALWTLADQMQVESGRGTVYDMSHARKFNLEFAHLREIDPNTNDNTQFKLRALALSLDVAVRRVDQMEDDLRARGILPSPR